MTDIRRVAVVAGNRIPFARQDKTYRHASNAAMLTAAIDGLVDRAGIAGEEVGEVVAGAVLKHSRDWNLVREVVLGSKLAPTTPAYDVQQACGTGLEAAILAGNKIALGQIDVGDRRRGRHRVGRSDRAQRRSAANTARGEPRAGRCRPAAGAEPDPAEATSCRRSRATPSRAPAGRWASTAR